LKILICTVLIFSGRKDPSWKIENEAIISRVAGLLSEAEVDISLTLDNSKLGYRGFRLESGKIVWEIYNGVISQRDESGKIIFQKDKNRIIEKLLLDTAPEEFSSFINSILSSDF
jgi:hypothetical protein